jgi:hypothetical protein
MRKLSSIIGLAILIAALPACAQHHHQRPSARHYNHNSWIAPFIIGAGATYILTRPTQPAVQPQIVLHPGQQITCQYVQVYNSYRGTYEIQQQCWAQ